MNVKKVGELRKAGLMTPAGLAAFERRTADNTGVYSFEPPGARAAGPADGSGLSRGPRGVGVFTAQAPWYRRTAIHLVVSAKRQDTRERRLARLIDDSRNGRTIRELTRPARKQ